MANSDHPIARRNVLMVTTAEEAPRPILFMRYKKYRSQIFEDMCTNIALQMVIDESLHGAW
jgi:hypothetical protein